MGFRYYSIIVCSLVVSLLSAGCTGAGGEAGAGQGVAQNHATGQKGRAQEPREMKADGPRFAADGGSSGTAGSGDGAALATKDTRVKPKWPQGRVLLEKATLDDAQVRAIVLDAFPVGTNEQKLLMEFPDRFVVFDMRGNEHCGITFGGKTAGMIGKSSILMTIDKVFGPLGVWPAVYYRYVEFGFDENKNLLGVVVKEENDAP